MSKKTRPSSSTYTPPEPSPEVAERRARRRRMSHEEAADDIAREVYANLSEVARKYREEHPDRFKYLQDLNKREEAERKRRG